MASDSGPWVVPPGHFTTQTPCGGMDGVTPYGAMIPGHFTTQTPAGGMDGVTPYGGMSPGPAAKWG